jgi:uncharacterized protein YndB with AHSA1/START domain
MATAPASSLSLTLRRTYAAPREAVFRAWTDPKELTRWWGPPGYDVPSADVDLKVGGRYRLAMRKLPDGEPYYVHGVYQEITIPERLVFTWNWEAGGPPFGSNTLVTLEFRETAGGTEMVLTHERFDTEMACTAHTKGWEGGLGKLSTFFDQHPDGLVRLP